jgi:hypothetical protein
MAQKGAGFKLDVPIDASQVEKEAEPQELKVVVQRQDGSASSQVVKVAPGRAGSATFEFDEHPGAARVLVGPATATDEELLGSQTLSVDVVTAAWRDARQLKLQPILIPPYFWWWWLRWCREFVIRGRVVCPDGSPVPGAEVCAYDVDWWFFWSSKQLVGCATTDAHGAFSLRFRWCCGWWPWWWWSHRIWELDRELVERITPVLERDPGLTLARTTNQPSLGVFGEILAQEGLATSRPLKAADVGSLEEIRGTLLPKLPPAPELEALRIWPWWPWWPWWDCTPDIIFRVTQDCHAAGTVILDEGIGATRWNIPDPLDVTLVANKRACCRPVCPERPCIEGECIDLARVCGASLDEIGGNPAAAASPVGYLYPGAVTPGSGGTNGDRPFAGTVTVEKANIMTGVDYYEIEYSDGGPWQALPAGAALDFSRHWMQPAVPLWHHGDVPFHWTNIAGHRVAESREHYEASPAWVALAAAGAFWTTNADLVVPLDSTKFGDGTHRFRVVGWRDGGGGTLVDREVLPVCESEIENELVLTFDNRLDPDPAHPASHPCGAGTVHLCVTEPDTAFLSVKVNGVEVDPCGVVEHLGGTLEIDFEAHDPDGHLASYSLQATYGSNLARDLLAQPSASLTPLAADYVGPTYGQALGQGASAPTWHGGTMRLTVDLAQAFPIPCCYQLELRAWKRTVVSCDGSFAHWNLSEYTIGVGVCPPPRHLVDAGAEAVRADL